MQVTQGTLTLRRATRSGCVAQTFGTGSGFIEDGGVVHEATAGNEPAVVYATFLARPATTSYLTPVAPPAGC